MSNVAAHFTDTEMGCIFMATLKYAVDSKHIKEEEAQGMLRKLVNHTGGKQEYYQELLDQSISAFGGDE